MPEYITYGWSDHFSVNSRLSSSFWKQDHRSFSPFPYKTQHSTYQPHVSHKPWSVRNVHLFWPKKEMLRHYWAVQRSWPRVGSSHSLDLKLLEMVSTWRSQFVTGNRTVSGSTRGQRSEMGAEILKAAQSWRQLGGGMWHLEVYVGTMIVFVHIVGGGCGLWTPAPFRDNVSSTHSLPTPHTLHKGAGGNVYHQKHICEKESSRCDSPVSLEGSEVLPSPTPPHSREATGP